MKSLIQLVREILHLSGKSQGISNTYGCDNHVNWLPISERRDFNILKLTHKAIHSSDFPEYLSLELHNIYTHNLRSSEAPLLLVPKAQCCFYF